MAWLPKEEAARRLGVSIDTVERKLKRGELSGQKEPRSRGWRWLVEVPEDVTGAEGSAAPASDPAEAPADAGASDSPALCELVHILKDQVDSLRKQVEADREELAAKNRQIGELHVLLQQQAQAALPAPKENRQSWWRFWER